MRATTLKQYNRHQMRDCSADRQRHGGLSAVKCPGTLSVTSRKCLSLSKATHYIRRRIQAWGGRVPRKPDGETLRLPEGGCSRGAILQTYRQAQGCSLEPSFSFRNKDRDHIPAAHPLPRHEEESQGQEEKTLRTDLQQTCLWSSCYRCQTQTEQAHSRYYDRYLSQHFWINTKTLILMSRRPSDRLAGVIWALLEGLLKGGLISIIVIPIILIIIVLIMNAML